MSEIPEKAIEAACRVENLQVSQRENAETVLRAALPALHEKWKAEAIERVKTMRYLNATGNVAWAYNGALDEAIRAIRGEPGE